MWPIYKIFLKLGYGGDPLSACQFIPPVEEVIGDLDPCEPNPCGPNSQHREVNGVCVCSCLPEYIGNPPDCRPECVVSSDCSQVTACLNQKCRDPCPGIVIISYTCRVASLKLFSTVEHIIFQCQLYIDTCYHTSPPPKKNLILLVMLFLGSYVRFSCFLIER